jgi:hypothetical protein
MILTMMKLESSVEREQTLQVPQLQTSMQKHSRRQT